MELNRLGLSLIILILVGSSSLHAQPIRIDPLTTDKTITSEDPSRFFFPGEVGIPLGDINGDGEVEYAFHRTFSADLSTPEQGDDTFKTMVCNYGQDFLRINCSFYNGGLIFPIGDINQDGFADVVVIDKEDMSSQHNGKASPLFDASTLENETPIIVVPTGGTTEGPGVMKDGSGYYFQPSPVFITDRSFTFVYDAGGESYQFTITNDDTFTEGEFTFGNKSMTAANGDVSGDSGDEIVILSTEFPNCNVQADIFSVSPQGALIHEQTEDIGGCNNSITASELRFQIIDIDGQEKEDILFSQNFYDEPGGFSRIFFDLPQTFVSLSSADESLFSPIDILFDNAALESVYEDAEGRRYVVGLAPDVYRVCPLVSNPTPEKTANAAQNSQLCRDPFDLSDVKGSSDQFIFGRFSQLVRPSILQVAQAVNAFTTIWAVGLSTVSPFASGIVVHQFEANQLPALAVTLLIITLDLVANFDRIISGTRAVPLENPVNANSVNPLGLITTVYFATNFFFTLAPETGFNFELTKNEEEIPVDRPSGPPEFVLPLNGLGIIDTRARLNDLETELTIDIIGAASIPRFYYFKGTSTSANDDTLRIIQSINMSDFQTFNEFANIKMNNIGDVNNDGADDLLVAPNFSTDPSFNPILKAWLFYGNNDQAPLSETPDVVMDFSADTTIGDFENPEIGASIESLGDVNGDGIDDFAIGLTGHQNTGSVYLYFGEDNVDKANTALSFQPDVVLRPNVEEGQSLNDFGRQISAGDFDGNGTIDIAVASAGSFGGDPTPTITIYHGGANMDGVPDQELYVDRQDAGNDQEGFLSGTFSSTIQFMPKEQGNDYQDLLFIPGAFTGFPNAVIFSGGAEADSLADIILVNPNQRTGFGFQDASKVAVSDFNEDGFYDIYLTDQFNGEDAIGSSRSYMFSPNSGLTPVSNEENLEVPEQYVLQQNYPNPFNPSTTIEFMLPRDSDVTLQVFDVLGREVARLVDSQRFGTGSHSINFNARNLATGVYIYRIQAGDFIQTKKMLLIK